MCEQPPLPLWNAAHFACQANNNSIYNVDKDQLRMLFSSEFLIPAEMKRNSPSSEWQCGGIDHFAAQVLRASTKSSFSLRICLSLKIQSLFVGLGKRQ